VTVVSLHFLLPAAAGQGEIITLHHRKRDLGDSLLEGTETSARGSADDLLELLREADV
jgi:hypothetical protein